jgi:hypothetical protein
LSRRGGSSGRRSLAFVCEQCEGEVYAALDPPAAEAVCPGCGRAEPLRFGTPASALERCLRCGLDRLYVQKDFNRKVGLGVFVLAAVLSVPTWGLSLLAATIIDLALYAVLGDVTLCYGCGAQLRGFVRNPAHGSFDLHVAEAVDHQPRAV